MKRTRTRGGCRAIDLTFHLGNRRLDQIRFELFAPIEMTARSATRHSYQAPPHSSIFQSKKDYLNSDKKKKRKRKKGLLLLNKTKRHIQSNRKPRTLQCIFAVDGCHVRSELFKSFVDGHFKKYPTWIHSETHPIVITEMEGSDRTQHSYSAPVRYRVLESIKLKYTVLPTRFYMHKLQICMTSFTCQMISQF